MSEPQNGAARSSPVGWPPFLRRPAAWGAGFDRLGVQRGMDRQPDGAEPYRPIFIGAALVSLFFAWRASTARRKPANRVRSARFPKWSYLQAHFLDRGRAGPGRARIPYVMPFFY